MHGSYCYITIAVVIGDVNFTLLALPVRVGWDKAETIQELITLAKKHFRIKLVLLDREFDGGTVTRKLKQIGIKHIIFVRKNDKVKQFFEQTEPFNHKYFHSPIEWTEDKSTQREPTKYLIIKDYVDLRTFKIYDWAFITNLSNIKTIHYIHLYKKRWAIETTYKQFKAFRIKTTSMNFIARYLFFLFRILLYNLWKFHNILTNTNTTLKEFTFKLFLAELDIDYVISCKQEIQAITNTTPEP